MPRKPTGQVLERRWKSGVGYALRLHAYGRRHYITLGLQAEGWDRRRAEDELQNILADVRRSIWIAPDRNQPARRAPTGQVGDHSSEPDPEPTFHRFASDWLAGRQGEISQRTSDYDGGRSRITCCPTSQTGGSRRSRSRRSTPTGATRSRSPKSAAARSSTNPARDGRDASPRPLSAHTINKTLDVLQMVLALAVEYGHITSNPAAGKRRRLKRPARRPIHLDSAQQIQALLDAATQLDRGNLARSTGRRATVATLLFAGLRAGELCELCWREVNLANGRIHVGRSKTQAGLREISLLPILRDELATLKAVSPHTDPEDPVFPTSTGNRRDKDNLRNRVLAPVLSRADELLQEHGHPPLPAGVTPHKLRHTFASVLVACGEDPAFLMAQLGHTDPKFTLRVYTHLMRREPAERARLQTLVEGQEVTLADVGDRVPLGVERRNRE